MNAQTIAEYRSDKDEYLRTDHSSPLPHEYRNSFPGLPYFEWNPDLVLTLPVTPGDNATVSVSTSDGAERDYKRVGSVELELAGESQTLHLYSTGQPGLFLPFRDATSGRETYGGGRYLDVEPNGDGTVTIDFNLAYSPFCAYNDRYSCALPPAENWVTAPIEAGEKTWRKPV